MQNNNHCEWDSTLVRDKIEKDEMGEPRTSDGAEQRPDFGQINT
jgi:hypothetical protein